MATTLDPRPVKLDWPVVAGDDESITFVIEDIDTSTRTYTCQVRTSPTAATATETATVAAVFVTPDTEVTVSLTNAQTRTLSDAGRTFYWDLQEDAGGVISTLIGGVLRVRPDVTR